MRQKGSASLPEEAEQSFCEFCVRGPAVSWRASQQGPKGRQRLQAWREAVAQTAAAAARGLEPSSKAVTVILAEFSERRTLNRDNMAKPILDAMQGVVYLNDRQVLDLRVKWFDIEGRYRVRYMPESLAAALSAGYEFVWIRVVQHRPDEPF